MRRERGRAAPAPAGNPPRPNPQKTMHPNGPPAKQQAWKRAHCPRLEGLDGLRLGVPRHRLSVDHDRVHALRQPARDLGRERARARACVCGCRGGG